MQVGLCDGAPAELLFGQPPYDVHMYFHFQESVEEKGRMFAHYSVLVPWDNQKDAKFVRLPETVLVAALMYVCDQHSHMIYIYI